MFSRTSGSGPLDVVLLHGWSADSRIWGPVMAEPPPGVRYVACDLPGHGRTPLRLGGRTYLEAAREGFAAWAKREGLAGAPMVAWAWGGQVLVDTAASGAIDPRSLMLVALPPPQDLPDPRSGPLSRDWPRYVRAIARMMFVRPPSPETEAWVTAVMRSCAPAAAGGIHEERWSPPGEEFRLPAGSVTVLGADDAIGKPEDAAALVRRWGSAVRLLDGCGHVPFIEDPDAFRGVLAGWIDDLTAKD